MVVKQDRPGRYYVETGVEYRGRPVFFGAVARMKSYVSHHLFPVYIRPDLLDGISPALRKRMQGKSCFNFTAVDEDLLAEIGRLTRRCLEEFRRRGLAPARPGSFTWRPGYAKNAFSASSGSFCPERCARCTSSQK
jgi:hypothetical protein